MPDDQAGATAKYRSTVRLGLAEAEALTAPFASLEAFRACSTSLDGKRLISHLSQRYLELGIHEPANLLLHGIGDAAETVDSFVVRTAHRILVADGDSARLAPIHERPGEEILRWRWISLAIPVDLMLGAADLAGRVRRVRVLDTSLQILEPTAHLHVHATAAVPFADIWQGMSTGSLINKIKSTPNGFDTVFEWRGWLRRAFIARWVLDYWMRYGLKKLTCLLGSWPQVDHALGDLRKGQLRGSTPFIESVIVQFLRWANIHLRTDGCCTHTQSDGLAVELGLNRRCLNHLRSGIEDPEQRAFRDLWLQMTRIRVLMYRHLVHDPARNSLDEFAERFARIDEHLHSSVKQEVRAAMVREPGIAFTTLELRKAPGNVSKLKQLHAASRSALRRPQLNSNEIHSQTGKSHVRLTWTLHFIRDSSFADGLRAQIQSHYRTAWKLSAVFRQHPELLQSIRALDVASRELCGPLWSVSAPLQLVREESRRVSSLYRGISPLGLTVHVGEDFRHLISGLRAIHEPFMWGLMSRGDRLGHALALGWDPYEWCSLHPEVVQPRSERMFDLAWMIEFVSRRSLPNVSAGIMEAAHLELQRHLHHWLSGASVSDFLRVVRELGKPWLWSELGGPFWERQQLRDGHWALLKNVLERYGEGDEVVTVQTGDHAKLLLIIRDELARLLARWRTPIEINPSSNMLIGNMAHPIAQPLFHLDPFDRDEMRGLVLTLSADDPACFATSLADEFAYAWAGLVVGSGESPTYAQEWLERAARAARRAAF